MASVNRLPFLAQHLFNQPLAIHPRKCEVIIAALAERLGVATLTRLTGERPRPVAFIDDEDDAFEFSQEGRNPDKGYTVLQGVALVPVTGTLVKRLGGVRPWSGMTGYNQIRGAFLCAVEDPAVKAIMLDVDSPGGEVNGLFDLVDQIYGWRGTKPIWAILNEIAYSAAYAIASAADKIIVPRTGGTGSIGVMCCHVDFSKALTAAGLNVTFIHYGARKIDGVPEKPLTPEALASFQADIDAMGEMFVDAVARNRSLTAATVRGMEAATYLGAAGVEAGLADAVMAPDAAFRMLRDSL